MAELVDNIPFNGNEDDLIEWLENRSLLQASIYGGGNAIFKIDGAWYKSEHKAMVLLRGSDGMAITDKDTALLHLWD